jgi:hypothetical protein
MADGQTTARQMLDFGVGVTSVSTNKVMKTLVVMVSRRFAKGAKAHPLEKAPLHLRPLRHFARTLATGFW